MKKQTPMTLEEARQDYLDERDPRMKAGKKRAWRGMKWAEQERRMKEGVLRAELRRKT